MPSASVGDLHANVVGFQLQAEVDGRPGRRVAGGVFQQVGQHVVDLRVVAGYERQLIGNREPYRSVGEHGLQPR